MSDSGQAILPPVNEFYEATDRDLVYTHTGNDATAATALKWVLSEDPSTTVLITKTLGSGIAAGSPTEITASLVKADTSGLGGETYYWELRMTHTGKEDVIASGTLKILRGNTD